MNHKLATTCLVLCVGILARPIAAPGQVLSDATISVDDTYVTPGQPFAIPVRLSDNSHDISGLVVPMKYPSAALNIDSVSFIGSILTDAFEGAFRLVPDSGIVQIAYLVKPTNLAALHSPNGIIGTIYGSVPPSTPSQVAILDSLFVVEHVGDHEIWYYRVQMTDSTGTIMYLPEFEPGHVIITIPTALEDTDTEALPNAFALAQNYPNPFNPTTTIEYSLPQASHVKIQIFNVLGQLLTTLVDRRQEAGVHTISFDASEHPSGIYFYRMLHDSGTETRKMILVK